MPGGASSARAVAWANRAWAALRIVYARGRNATGRAVHSISAGCLRYPDSAKIRRGDKGRYPKIARKFQPSPLRL